MPDAVLTINAGSSSIKFATFNVAAEPVLDVHGGVVGIGSSPHLTVRNAKGDMLFERSWRDGVGEDFDSLLPPLLEWIESHLRDRTLLAAGHRFVHGGERFSAPQRLDPAALAALDQLTPMAPLHQPHSLLATRAVMGWRPGLPQIGCFDTAFHHGQPEVATMFGLPRRLHAAGIRRYGFHGISYEFVIRRLRMLAPVQAAGRVIVAHLGNGASLCAMLDGRSIATSMGLTPLDGLVMGTRCGSIDPGALLYLLQDRGMSVPDLQRLLYEDCGLLGVSGLSSDMHVLLASDRPEAKEAVALFVYRAASEICAHAAALGGVQCLIFTGGIGEHAASVRAAICERLCWLGVDLDPLANDQHAAVISLPGSRVEVRVIPTDEEAMIARHCIEALQA